MQTLTIKALTLESAGGFMSALADFQAELKEAEDGGYLVAIELGRGDCEIIALLNALQDYLNRRAHEPAEVGLSGRTYTLHPTGRPENTEVAAAPLLAP